MLLEGLSFLPLQFSAEQIAPRPQKIMISIMPPRQLGSSWRQNKIKP